MHLDKIQYLIQLQLLAEVAAHKDLLVVRLLALVEVQAVAELLTVADQTAHLEVEQLDKEIVQAQILPQIIQQVAEAQESQVILLEDTQDGVMAATV